MPFSIDKVKDLQHKPGVKGFWKFINERHRIWHRRFRQKQQPPWTKDPILQSYLFTNVYRELDWGTIWAYHNVLLPNKTDYINMLWQTIVYRCMNLPATFEEVGLPDREAGVDLVFRKRLRKRAKNGPVFSTAYAACAFNSGKKTRLDTYFYLLKNAHKQLHEIYRDMYLADTSEEAWEVVKRIWGVADFIAFEILNDMLYMKFPPHFTENDFVCIGPGAKSGLELLFGKLSKKECYEALTDLRTSQRKSLPKNFPYYRNKLITLACIENCLCEYRKYVALKNGVGKPRKFRPNALHIPDRPLR